MKIELHREGGVVFVGKLPYVDAEYVVFRGHQCECSRKHDLCVGGTKGTTQEVGNQIIAQGRCVTCNGIVGKLVVTFDTLFGAEEDRRVLNGRPRVY